MNRPAARLHLAFAALLLALWVSPCSLAVTLDEALDAKRTGQHGRALAMLQELATQNPADAQILYHLGTVQGWLGRHDDALATFRRALALAPQDADIRVGYGRILAWTGKLTQAEAVFRQIAAEHPENLEALNMLGRVLAWQNQLQSADAVYASILETAPDNTDALIGRGDLHRTQQRYAEARGFYQRALAIEPDSADLKQRLASVRTATAWRLDLGWEYSSFSGNTRDDWHGWDAALRYALDHRTGIALGVEQAHRFARDDTQISLGADTRFTDDWSGYARLSITPEADFFARHTTAAGASWRARRGTGSLPATLLLADYRAATYSPGTAHSLGLGATQYLTGHIALTGKVLLSRNLNARWTDGWLLRLEGEPSERWRWNLGYADSSESLSSTLFDFLGNLRTRASFGGVTWEASPTLCVRLDFTHERTSGGLQRNAIHVGFTPRF